MRSRYDEEPPPSTPYFHYAGMGYDRYIKLQRHPRHLYCPIIAGRAVGNRFAPIVLLRHTHSTVTGSLDPLP